jgi:hypothetical protein
MQCENVASGVFGVLRSRQRGKGEKKRTGNLSVFITWIDREPLSVCRQRWRQTYRHIGGGSRACNALQAAQFIEDQPSLRQDSKVQGVASSCRVGWYRAGLGAKILGVVVELVWIASPRAFTC